MGTVLLVPIFIMAHVPLRQIATTRQDSKFGRGTGGAPSFEPGDRVLLQPGSSFSFATDTAVPATVRDTQGVLLQVAVDAKWLKVGQKPCVGVTVGDVKEMYQCPFRWEVGDRVLHRNFQEKEGRHRRGGGREPRRVSL